MKVNFYHTFFDPLNMDKELYNLIFKDKNFEKEFYQQYHSRTVSFMMLHLTIGILFYGGFGLVGTGILPEKILRFGVVLPLFVLLAIAVYFNLIKKGLYLILSAFILILTLSYMLVMNLVSYDQLYYLSYLPGLILIILSFNALFRLKLKQMLVINTCIATGYWLLDYFYAQIQVKRPYEFWVIMAEILTACFIGWIACYNFEYFYRNDFYRKKIISEQAHALQLANAQMELKIAQRTHELEIEKHKSYKAVLQGQHSERQRIAQDLHDSVNISLINLKRKVEANNIDHNSLLTDIDTLIDFIREISHNMLPYTLVHFGLLYAIEELCGCLKVQHGFQIEYSPIGVAEDTRWDTVIETEIFRMIQELITNIIKHANASKIGIELINSQKILYLTIADNGVGFDHFENNLSCFGINNVRARVELLNGTINFDSVPQKGTTILINIPLQLQQS